MSELNDTLRAEQHDATKPGSNGALKQRTILVPIVDYSLASDLIRVATALLSGTVTDNGTDRESEPCLGRIILLAIVEVPEERSLSEGARQAQRLRLKLGKILSKVHLPQGAGVVEVQSIVRVSYQVWQGIRAAAQEQGADTLVLGWRGFTKSPERVYGTTIDETLKDPPCDVVVVKPAALECCRKILLPVRGGQYAELGLKVATSLAVAIQGTVTVMHSTPEIASQMGHDDPYRAFRRLIEGQERISRIVTARSEAAEDAILEEATDHDLVIMGATAMDPTPSSLGRVVEAVARHVDKTIVIVRTREPVDLEAYSARATDTLDARSETFAENGATRASNARLSLLVDKWFAENTFHSREFRNMERLAALKRRQGLTISLGLPALNEGQTIGPIIQTFKHHFMDKYPLLDEIVLIDSGSTDETVPIATSLGIPVYFHQEILPEMGTYRGKGEALWKSLHVLRGDIIAWIDTDIRNIHPAFVYGLLGPLLREPKIKYVKGFYQRPLAIGEKLTAAGGGRVTELTARPILNLFFPELSGLIQPLSGEYAGRREVLEQVPFFTGYGVETGLLIDILDRFGLESIAQVDLLKRIHRNQTLFDLSQMSFAIIQVFVRRLEDRHRLHLLEQFNKSMKLIRDRRDGYYLDLKEIGDCERPPIATLKEYEEARLRAQAQYVLR